MQEEGVIKFDLQFADAAPLSPEPYVELNRWRSVLWKHGLIGRDPARYEGFGFGNVSQRIDGVQARTGRTPFIVSGSQTGELPVLGPEHYACVSDYDIQHNRVIASGPIRPSSESLTHATLYEQSDDIDVVLHVHSPVIWLAADDLALPVTDKAVPYGTPAMAEEVVRLFAETDVAERKILSMNGHQDGVIAFGKSAEEAGSLLMDTLRRCA